MGLSNCNRCAQQLLLLVEGIVRDLTSDEHFLMKTLPAEIELVEEAAVAGLQRHILASNFAQIYHIQITTYLSLIAHHRLQDHLDPFCHLSLASLFPRVPNHWLHLPSLSVRTAA